MFRTKFFAYFLSLAFLAKLNNGAQAQQQSSFITTQQSTTKFFSLTTNSTTTDFKEQDGTTSLFVVTNVSFVFDNFTYTVLTTSKYNSAQLVSVKTEAYTLTKNFGGVNQSVTKYTQLGCTNGTNIGTPSTTKVTGSTTPRLTNATTTTSRASSSSIKNNVTTTKPSSLSSTFSTIRNSTLISTTNKSTTPRLNSTSASTKPSSTFSTIKNSTLTSTTKTTTKTSTSTTTKSLSANNVLITAEYNSIKVFDLNSGLLINSIELNQALYKMLLVENKYAIGLAYDDKINVWDLATSELTCSTDFIFSGSDLVFIDAQYFASYLYWDQWIKVFNIRTCLPVYAYKLDSYPMYLVKISANLLASFSEDGAAQILNANGLTLKAHFSLPDYDQIYASENFLIFINSFSIYLVNMNDFGYNKTIFFDGYRLNGLFVYNDYIVSNQQNNVLVFSISRGSMVFKLDAKSGGHRNDIQNAVLFKNSGIYATIGYDQVIKIWDLNKLVIKNTLDLGFVNPSYFAAGLFSIGKSYLVSYGSGDQSFLWDVENGALVYSLDTIMNEIILSNVNSNFSIVYPTTTTSKVQTTTKPTATTTRLG